jgi:hypothetical protein
MHRRSKKKVLAGVLGVLLALSAVTGAVAYFTGASANSTGTGTVGSSNQWGIAMSTPTWSGTLHALYPGASNDTELMPFTVTNNGSGNQGITSVQVKIPTINGDVTSGGAEVTGCQATWFNAALDSHNPAVPADLAASGTYTGNVDLVMNDVNSSQDACQGAHPDVTVTVS